MADRRTNIIISVQGLAELQAANTAMNRHNTLVQKLTAAYSGLNAITGSVASGMTSVNTTFNNTNTTINNTDRSTNSLRVSLGQVGQTARSTESEFSGMLATMLRARAIAFIFGEIQRAMTEAVKAGLEFEKQAARIARVGGAENTPFVRAGIAEEAARTGASIADLGEAYYQLRTQIHDNETAFSAMQNVMNLVIGTQSDARDTSRALLQIYNQFGDSLDHSVGKTENMRRITELLAITFKDADAEMVDITAALKYLGPVAEAAKVPLEQVTATISALTTEGHRGRMGGTEAAQFISNLIKNYNQELGGIEKNGLVFHFDLARTKEGGIDLINTIRNVVEAANTLPTEKAQVFLRTISGSQNSFRFLGTAGVEFMRHLTEEVEKATQAMKGQTNEAEKLKDTMMTTGQEWQRVWTGSITAIANMLDASGIKKFFHDVADDLQRANDSLRGMAGTNVHVGNVLGGQGSFAGDTRARFEQLSTQRAILQEVLQSAREKGVSGKPSFSESLYGVFQMGGFGANNAGGLDLYNEEYRNRPASERGFLQQFMTFRHPTTDPTLNTITMDLPAMQAEMTRLNAELAGLNHSAPLGPGNVPAVSSLGLHGLSATQAQNAAIITAAAKKYGVDPLAMIAVANYESGLSAGATNPSSSATGLFQILRGTAPGIDRTNPYQNAEFAAKAIAQSGGRGLTGEEAIRQIVEKFERPGAAATPGEEAGAIRFYTNQGLGGNRRSGPAITKDPKTLQAEADAADRKAQEAKDNYAKLMQIKYEKAVKDFGAEDARSLVAAKQADAAASAASDAYERMRLKYGLSGNVPALGEQRQKDREQAQKDAERAQREADAARKEALTLHASATEYYAEIAPQKYGLFSDTTTRRAQEAQQAALEAAKSDGDIILSWKLLAGVEGPLKNLMDSRRDATDKLQEQIATVNENLKRDEANFVGALVESGDRRSRAIQRTERPNALFGNADSRRDGALTAQIASIQQTIDLLAKIQEPTDETIRQMQELKERLLDANVALVDFRDTVARQQLEKSLKGLTDKYDTKLNDLENKNLPRAGETEKQAAQRERALAVERAQFAEKKYQELAVFSVAAGLQGVSSDLTKGALEQADIDRKSKEQAIKRLDAEQAQANYQKYAQVKESVAGQVQSSLLAFFHGQGSIGSVFQGLGNTIVDTALEQQIKKFSDPLVNTVTKQVLELQHNTDALQAMTNALNGGGSSSGGIGGVGAGSAVGSGLAGVIATGVGVGLAGGFASLGSGGTSAGAGGVAGKASRSGHLLPGKGDQYLNEGLAAYSVFSQAQQQGSTLGSVLGGALAGAAIGGPIGALVGGGLSLLGGLFHQKSKPTASPQDLNPSAYNAPAGFDVAAYNYSAYGKLPTLQDVGFDVKAAKTPVVNVYVDGAKVAARQEVANQTSLARVSLTNTGAGYGHTPL